MSCGNPVCQYHHQPKNQGRGEEQATQFCDSTCHKKALEFQIKYQAKTQNIEHQVQRHNQDLLVVIVIPPYVKRSLLY
jgi:hypothetical protein